MPVAKFIPAPSQQQSADDTPTTTVTLTDAQLAGALRLGDSTEELAEVTRLRTYAAEAVTRHAPAAPTATSNEAAIRLASYLFDQPHTGRGAMYAAAMRNSGAAAILLPYREHRAGAC